MMACSDSLWKSRKKTEFFSAAKNDCHAQGEQLDFVTA
jgi:hypothetical protein